MTEHEAHVAGDTTGHHMAVDLVSSTPKRVLMVVANPTVSSNNGWPVGFWAAELTHPYYEFTQRGVEVTVASPDGGRVEFDNLSDPRDPSRWSADDLISLGFVHTPELLALLADTPRLAGLDLDTFDALLICGGQSPMFTFRDHPDLQATVRHFYEAERITGALCHGVSALVDVRLSDGRYLVEGRTVTGFANVEEDYGNAAAGVEIMPWRLEDVLRERGANYLQAGLFKAFAVRDGRLVTGQQQYSGRAVAEQVIAMLGL
ncbi:type 1 glutamine amidotransferase domain-containing protein [Jatrophihabitans fulvus]